MTHLTRGAQLHQQIKRSEWVQGVSIPRGTQAVIPFTLADKPQSAKALKMLVAPSLNTQARLMCQGLDYSVDILNRKITWLSTARWPLVATNHIIFDYWTYGYTA